MPDKLLSDYIIQTLAGLTVVIIIAVVGAVVGYIRSERFRNWLAPARQRLQLLFKWSAERWRYILIAVAFIVLEVAFLFFYHDWRAVLFSVGFALIMLSLLIVTNVREARQRVTNLNERKRGAAVNLTPPKNCEQMISDLNGWVHSLAFSSDGRFLGSAADDDHVKLWPWLSHGVGDPHSLGGNPSGATHIPVTAFVFLPELQYLVTGSAKGELKIWDIEKKEELKHIDAHKGVVCCLAANYAQEETLLASGSDDGTVTLWKMPYANEKRILETQFRERVTALTFSPENGLLFASSADGSLCVWDTAILFNLPQGDKTRVSKISMQEGAITSLAFSPNGTLLAYALTDGSIRLRGMLSSDWLSEFTDILSEKFKIASVVGHFQAVRSIAFSPDGDMLASASNDKSIKLWDVNHNDLRIIRTLGNHDKETVSLAFSPDGMFLASGSHGEIGIWSLAVG